MPCFGDGASRQGTLSKLKGTLSYFCKRVRFSPASVQISPIPSIQQIPPISPCEPTSNCLLKRQMRAQEKYCKELKKKDENLQKHLERLRQVACCPTSPTPCKIGRCDPCPNDLTQSDFDVDNYEEEEETEIEPPFECKLDKVKLTCSSPTCNPESDCHCNVQKGLKFTKKNAFKIIPMLQSQNEDEDEDGMRDGELRPRRLEAADPSGVPAVEGADNVSFDGNSFYGSVEEEERPKRSMWGSMFRSKKSKSISSSKPNLNSGPRYPTPAFGAQHSSSPGSYSSSVQGSGLGLPPGYVSGVLPTSRSSSVQGSGLGLPPGYVSGGLPTSRSRSVQGSGLGLRPRYVSGVRPMSRSRSVQGSGLGLRPGYVSGVRPMSRSRSVQGSGLGLRPGYVSGVRPGYVSGVRPGYVSGVRPMSRSRSVQGSGLGLRPGYVSGLRPWSRSRSAQALRSRLRKGWRSRRRFVSGYRPSRSSRSRSRSRSKSSSRSRSKLHSNSNVKKKTALSKYEFKHVKETMSKSQLKKLSRAYISNERKRKKLRNRRRKRRRIKRPRPRNLCCRCLVCCALIWTILCCAGFTIPILTGLVPAPP